MLRFLKEGLFFSHWQLNVLNHGVRGCFRLRIGYGHTPLAKMDLQATFV